MSPGSDSNVVVVGQRDHRSTIRTSTVVRACVDIHLYFVPSTNKNHCLVDFDWRHKTLRRTCHPEPPTSHPTVVKHQHPRLDTYHIFCWLVGAWLPHAVRLLACQIRLPSCLASCLPPLWVLGRAVSCCRVCVCVGMESHTPTVS